MAKAKKPVKKAVKKAAPANKKPAPRKKADPIAKENAKLIAAFPDQLTDSDFIPTQGEERESVFGRVAEKLDMSVDELKEFL